MADVTPERLAEIEGLAAATTPGPWTTEKPGVAQDGPAKGMRLGVTIAQTSPSLSNRVFANPPGGQFPSTDQRFIAAARTDVPDLCAALRQAWAERDAAAEEARALREALEAKVCEWKDDASEDGDKFDDYDTCEDAWDAGLSRAFGLCSEAITKIVARPRTAHARIAEARERVCRTAHIFAYGGPAQPLCDAVDALNEAERATDAPGR